MSNVLTASTTSPCAAPADVKNIITATKHNVRKKISRLTLKKITIALFCNNDDRQSRRKRNGL